MDVSPSTNSNTQLRQERMRRNWRQQDLADELGTTIATIKRWERGIHQPSAYFRTRLCALFERSAEELGLIAESPPYADEGGTEATIPVENLPPSFLVCSRDMWSVPYPRNPFFTGRALVLEHLHTVLTHEPTIAALTQSYALHGLGGIGKTQLAIEYADQHRLKYDGVFWVEAETLTSLTSSFVILATVLSLPEKTEEDQRKIVDAVLRWLNQHEKWLLIFDNVEDLSLLKPFLPASDRGALLLTTRLQSLGTLAQTVELSSMTMQEGTNFLLMRIQRPVTNPQERADAEMIVAEMGGLPLALEQAGAYINAIQCHLSEYLHLFQTAQHRLLDAHELSSDHPLSVTRTFALAFEQVQQRNPLAAELLTVCAFLAPDLIPETFLLKGASWFGPLFEGIATDPLAFPEAIKVLLSYSLLQRHPTTQMITVHRLVQAVLKGSLSEVVQRTWIRRVITAMSRLFPSQEGIPDVYKLSGEPLLVHAQVCLFLGDQWNDEDEEVRISLMCHVATYLSSIHARETEAEALFKRATQMGEQVLGQQHPLVAEALYGLGRIYHQQGLHKQAQFLYERALHIKEQSLGPEHPQLIFLLNSLGFLAIHQGHYDQHTQSLLERAIHIGEQTLDPEHPFLVSPLTNLGLILYNQQGKRAQAQSLLERAMSIREKAIFPEHPGFALPLTILGSLYINQGQYTQAQLLLEQAVRITEKAFGPEHHFLVNPLAGLGHIYSQQGQYTQAQPLLERAVRIGEQAFGPEHHFLAFPLAGLGHIYSQQGQYTQAQPLLERAMRIEEQASGPEHPQVIFPLANLGLFYSHQGQYAQAQPLLERAVHIGEQMEQVLVPDYIIELTEALDGLANLYREQGQYDLAKSSYQRALMLRQQRLGPEHPDIAETLHDLAHLCHLQQQLTEAFSHYQQALTIREQALGQEHPKTQKTRHVLTQLIQEMRDLMINTK